MDNEKQLARAVVESITYMTGYPPRRSQSIVPQLLFWISSCSVATLALALVMK